jgi:hypothetical protein
MTPIVRILSLFCLFALPMILSAQGKRDAVVIFKDGFDIKGKVNEKIKDFVFDKESGRSFPILSGQFFIDDHVREMSFSPHQVTRVYQPKEGEFQEPMRVWRFDKVYQNLAILPEFVFEDFGKWSDKGERIVNVFNPSRANTKSKGRIAMEQRIGVVTPQYLFAATTDYQWNQLYFADEFGPDLTRKIVSQIMSEKKEYKGLTDGQKLLELAKFSQQAGWYKEAERDVKAIIENYPNEKKVAEELLAKMKEEKANQFAESVEKAAAVGQHSVVADRVAGYERLAYAKLVTPKLRLSVTDLKTKYDKAKSDIEQAKAYLKELPALTKKKADVWTKATECILDELNPDTVDRLDTFLVFAQQHEMDRKANKKPGQTIEEVLALAVTGWLQGKLAAEPDVKTALKLAKGREFLVEYMTTDNPLKRASLLSAFQRDNDLPIDVMARLIAMIPPVAHDPSLVKKEIQTLQTPDGGSYQLLLPPDYHHQRAYPVMILLASGRDSVPETVERFSGEAARQGFIIAAPQWAGKKAFKGRREPGVPERQLVLDTLRDLRRRFQVDSDRVFLWGWEDGGGLAIDVGLGHPDLFAGLVPMNGTFTQFTRRYYWPNAQYLPLYIIEGERNGGNPKIFRDAFEKGWRKNPYSVIYVEYRGRSSEWYGMEIPKMLNWASRKKRYTPLKEMGCPNFGTELGEEFHSTRAGDNRFYWLSAETIADKYLMEHSGKWTGAFRPATFQVNLSLGNKSDKAGTAKIFNQADIRSIGTKKLTFWITPGMMDLSKPLTVRVNTVEVIRQRMIAPSLETMLEEVYRTGDRQRVYVAKVEL